jgi:phosphopantothenoylcysteine decarboxylase/phosphopantothenate--cysteine ligase
MAAGIADDLATTVLLATDKPVLAVPAMNVRMWQHAATIRNVAQLRDDGITVLERMKVRWPVGNTALTAAGAGRHPVGDRKSFGGNSRLSGKHIIVTAGPTQEPVDRSGSSPTAHREAGLRRRGRFGGAWCQGHARSGPVNLDTRQDRSESALKTARRWKRLFQRRFRRTRRCWSPLSPIGRWSPPLRS